MISIINRYQSDQYATVLNLSLSGGDSGIFIYISGCPPRQAPFPAPHAPATPPAPPKHLPLSLFGPHCLLSLLIIIFCFPPLLHLVLFSLWDHFAICPFDSLPRHAICFLLSLLRALPKGRLDIRRPDVIPIIEQRGLGLALPRHIQFLFLSLVSERV